MSPKIAHDRSLSDTPFGTSSHMKEGHMHISTSHGITLRPGVSWRLEPVEKFSRSKGSRRLDRYCLQKGYVCDTAISLHPISTHRYGVAIPIWNVSPQSDADQWKRIKCTDSRSMITPFFLDGCIWSVARPTVEIYQRAIFLSVGRTIPSCRTSVQLQTRARVNLAPLDRSESLVQKAVSKEMNGISDLTTSVESYIILPNFFDCAARESCYAPKLKGRCTYSAL